MRGPTTLGGLVIAAAAVLYIPSGVGQQEASGDSDDVGTDTTLVPQPAVAAPRAKSALLLDIAKVGDHWVAVGQRGDVLISPDAKAWVQVAVPVDTTLTRVRFLDATHGWAVGYDGAIIGTEDGGKSWKLLQFDAGWGKPYFDVVFSDATTGLLAGANGTLKRTSDGGKTWEDISSGVLQETPNIYNLITLGDGSLLMAGERGFLARSTDKGATWTQLKSPYTGSFFGALPQGATGAIVFGLRGNAFLAGDISKAAVLSAKDLAAMQAAAADAENAASSASPVSDVAGWTRLKSNDTEPLFGGTVSSDGRTILFGQNGRVMQVDASTTSLQRVAVDTDINMNAGLVDGASMLVVGTSGVTQLTAH